MPVLITFPSDHLSNDLPTRARVLAFNPNGPDRGASRLYEVYKVFKCTY